MESVTSVAGSSTVGSGPVYSSTEGSVPVTVPVTTVVVVVLVAGVVSVAAVSVIIVVVVVSSSSSPVENNYHNLALADCTWNCTHPQPILTILNLLELPLYNNVRKHNNSDADIVDELYADEQPELQMN